MRAGVCKAHRRRVIVAWVAVAVILTVVARVVGPNYITAYSLPGTQTQRASDLLKQDFSAQNGDADVIVFRASQGTIESPAIRAAITPLLAKVAKLRHVSGVISPYGSRGAAQISRNRMTAFATVNYDQPTVTCRR